jgi:multiple antibiotic resistance protein
MRELASSALTMFFVTIGPIEVATIFLAVTPGFSPNARTKIAIIASSIGGLTLFVFALGGNALLHALGVGLPAFRAAGGILLLKMAADLVFLHHSQLSSLSKAEEDEAIQHTSIAVFPLSIPLIAGPGSMTAAVLLMGRASTPVEQAMVLGSLALIMLSTFAALVAADRLVKFLGLIGSNVVARISGILLAALATQFVFDGLRESGILG